MTNQGNSTGNGRQTIVALGVIMFSALVCLGVRQNQFLPLPGQKVPVVPQLPGIAAELKRAKSLCEGRARDAKAAGKKRLTMSPREYQKGPQLYTDAKAEFDGCITFLCAAMDRKFIENDSKEIEKRMKQAGEKMASFLKWSDTLHSRIGAESPLGQIPELVVELVKFINDADDKIRETLKKELKDCSFRDWGDLPDK